MRRLHLHPQQPPPVVQDQVISRTLAPRLRHSESQRAAIARNAASAISPRCFRVNVTQVCLGCPNSRAFLAREVGILHFPNHFLTSLPNPLHSHTSPFLPDPNHRRFPSSKFVPPYFKQAPPTPPLAAKTKSRAVYRQPDCQRSSVYVARAPRPRPARSTLPPTNRIKGGKLDFPPPKTKPPSDPESVEASHTLWQV